MASSAIAIAIASNCNSSTRSSYDHHSNGFDLRRVRQLSSVILLAHPNTIAYKSVTSAGAETTVTASLLPGITLSHFLTQRRALLKSELDTLFMQMLIGVQSLHKHHVTHTKLHPNNIFVLEGTSDDGQREPQVTLGDYLITDPNTAPHNNDTAGSFIAPECWIHPQR